MDFPDPAPIIPSNGPSIRTKEEYQKIKKRTLTEPYVDSVTDNGFGEGSRGSIELESPNNANKNNNIKGRGARIQSMSVDMGRNNYQNHNQEYDFLQTLTTNLNESLAQGLHSLAMVGAWNMHESRIAKLKKHVNNNNNTKNISKHSKQDNQKPLLSDTEVTDSSLNADDMEPADMEIAKKCTYAETFSNLMQYGIGVVVFCMPYVVAIGGSIEIIFLIIIFICSLLSALMIDELINNYNDVNSYSDLVLRLFGIKGQLLCTIITFLELFLYVIATIVLAADLLYTLNHTSKWMLDNIGSWSLEECILIWGLIFLPLVQITDLKPLAKLSGLGLLGVIATFIALVVVCIERQINGTAEIRFSNLFNNFENHFYTQVYKCGYGVGTTIALFCLHTLIPTLKQGMQKPKEFRSIIYLVWMALFPLISLVILCGYVTYGTDSKSPVTSNFSGVYGPIVLVAVGIKAASFMPSGNLPLTLLLSGFIKQLKCVANVIGTDDHDQYHYEEERSETQGSENNNSNDKPERIQTRKAKIVLKCIRFGVPTFLLILALIVSICIKSMAFISALAGSVCALIMSIILPCAMYVKYLIKVKKFASSESIEIAMKYVHVIVAVCVLLIVCSFAGWNLVCLVYYGP